MKFYYVEKQGTGFLLVGALFQFLKVFLLGIYDE